MASPNRRQTECRSGSSPCRAAVRDTVAVPVGATGTGTQSAASPAGRGGTGGHRLRPLFATNPRGIRTARRGKRCRAPTSTVRPRRPERSRSVTRTATCRRHWRPCTSSAPRSRFRSGKIGSGALERFDPRFPARSASIGTWSAGAPAVRRRSSRGTILVPGSASDRGDRNRPGGGSVPVFVPESAHAPNRSAGTGPSTPLPYGTGRGRGGAAPETR